MIGSWLVLLGLAFGSFVNALVWRVYQQSLPKRKRKAADKELSVVKGRSMCPNCKHPLAWHDLLPVVSWVLLRGKCRYCKRPISIQYPLVEVSTAVLFVLSYMYWPHDLASVASYFLFILWLTAVVLLVSLLIYDLKWMLLPNKIMAPLAGIALLSGLLTIFSSDNSLRAIVDLVTTVTVGGGLFFVLFQWSKGEWIGGGDVKLGAVLGLLLAQPELAFIMLFGASLLGLLVALPAVVKHEASLSSKLPFGPYLIVAAVIAKLFSSGLIEWYTTTFLHM